MFLPFNLWTAYKAALSPGGVNSQKPRVKAGRLQEWVYSLYQLAPAQASLTHRLFTCLEWTMGEPTSEVIQRATDQTSFIVNCVQVMTTHLLLEALSL